VGRRPAKPWKMREKVAVVLPLNRLLLVTIAKARQSNVVQKKLMIKPSPIVLTKQLPAEILPHKKVGRIEDLKGS
jgi:hypothetical protein